MKKIIPISIVGLASLFASAAQASASSPVVCGIKVKQLGIAAQGATPGQAVDDSINLDNEFNTRTCTYNGLIALVLMTKQGNFALLYSKRLR